jgi:uncharacterized protein YecT (DUF1311 family)
MKKLAGMCTFAVLFASAPAHAICENNPTVGCMRTALESADQQLNFVFKRLLVSAPPAGEKQLRDAQRTWLQDRDAAVIGVRFA